MVQKVRKGGYLGFYFHDDPEGVRVTGTYEGSPASRLGILPGDRIVGVNDLPRPVNGDLLLRTIFTSDSISLSVLREDRILSFPTSLRELDGILAPGDPAPDFSLEGLNGIGKVRLSTLWDSRPVLLLFGSYT